jgi:hypothetical protein
MATSECLVKVSVAYSQVTDLIRQADSIAKLFNDFRDMLVDKLIHNRVIGRIEAAPGAGEALGQITLTVGVERLENFRAALGALDLSAIHDLVHPSG